MEESDTEKTGELTTPLPGNEIVGQKAHGRKVTVTLR